VLGAERTSPSPRGDARGRPRLLTKDFSPAELIARVRKTLAQLRAGRELERLHDVEATHVGRPLVMGSSPRNARGGAGGGENRRQAGHRLITGRAARQEVLARYIHARSDRKTSPFVA